MVAGGLMDTAPTELPGLRSRHLQNPCPDLTCVAVSAINPVDNGPGLWQFPTLGSYVTVINRVPPTPSVQLLEYWVFATQERKKESESGLSLRVTCCECPLSEIYGALPGSILVWVTIRGTHAQAHMYDQHTVKGNSDNQAQEPGWERRKKGFCKRQMPCKHQKKM